MAESAPETAKEIEDELAKKYEAQRTKLQGDIDKLNGKAQDEEPETESEPAEESAEA